MGITKYLHMVSDKQLERLMNSRDENILAFIKESMNRIR